MTKLKCKIFYAAFNQSIYFSFKNTTLSICYPLWVCCVEHEAEATLQDIWLKSSQDAVVKCFVMNMYLSQEAWSSALREHSMLWSAPLILITRCSCAFCSTQTMTTTDINGKCVQIFHHNYRNSEFFFYYYINNCCYMNMRGTTKTHFFKNHLKMLYHTIM